MASVNRVIIVGNLGRDPDVRKTTSGAKVATLGVATTRSWRSKDGGEKVEETEWHRVVLYDRLAEIAEEYLKKGRSVYVEGRLKTRKWQDEAGDTKYTTEIVAEQLQMLGGKQDNSSPQETQVNDPYTRENRAGYSAASARSSRGKNPAANAKGQGSSGGYNENKLAGFTDDGSIPF